MDNFYNLNEEELIKKANGKLFVKNYDDALKIFSRILELNPKNLKALEWKATIQNIKGDYQSAIYNFSELIKLDPKQLSFYLRRGKAKKNLKEIDSAAEDFLFLIKSSTNILKSTPKDKSIWSLRGEAKFEINDFEGAIHDYTEAIILDPKNKESLLGRGDARYELDDFNGAIYDYSKVILLDPKHIEAIESRGAARFELDDFNGAINDYSILIKLDPDNVDLYILRGNIKYYSKNFNGAIDDYHQAVKLNQNAIDNINHSNLYATYETFNIGEARDKDAKIKNVKDKLTKQKLAELFSISGDKKYKIGDFNGYFQDYKFASYLSDRYLSRKFDQINQDDLSEEQEKEIERSITKFSNQILLNPQNKEAFFSRGDAKFSLYDYKGAINDYSKVITLDPKHIEALESRGDAKYILDDYRGALNDYSEAINLDPDNSDLFLNRSHTKRILGDFESAIDDFYKSVKLNPNHDNSSLGFINSLFYDITAQNIDQKLKEKIERIFFNLGLIKYKIGKYEDAISHYSRSIELNPLNFNSLINRGLAKEQLRYWESANNDYLKAKKINPNNQMVIKKLSRLRGKTNNGNKWVSQSRGNIKKLKSNNNMDLGSRNFKRLDEIEYQNLKESYRPLLKKGNYSNTINQGKMLSFFLVLLITGFVSLFYLFHDAPYTIDVHLFYIIFLVVMFKVVAEIFSPD